MISEQIVCDTHEITLTRIAEAHNMPKKMEKASMKNSNYAGLSIYTFPICWNLSLDICISGRKERYDGKKDDKCDEEQG